MTQKPGRVLSLILCIAMTGVLTITGALPVFSPKLHAITRHNLSGGGLRITNAGTYYITGMLDSSYEGIVIAQNIDGDVNVTLDSARINADTPLFIGSGSSVNLTLLGSNSMYSTIKSTALLVASDASLTITAQSTGTLLAISDGGTAIGGDYENDCGKITINGGIIVAQGGGSSAAVGGAMGRHAGEIIINGGFLGAVCTGGETTISAAGIGGGMSCTGGSLIINGGQVSAMGNFAPGIGVGMGAQYTRVIINGGTVDATGGQYSPGIGVGMLSSIDTITIGGGTVTATGDGEFPSIGCAGSAGSYIRNINITGGSVIIGNPSDTYSRISGSLFPDEHVVSITGGSVEDVFGVQPTNGAQDVFLVTATLPGFSDVASFALTVDSRPFGTSATHEDGKLYLWLTAGEHTIQAVHTQTKIPYHATVSVTDDNLSSVTLACAAPPAFDFDDMNITGGIGVYPRSDITLVRLTPGQSFVNAQLLTALMWENAAKPLVINGTGYSFTYPTGTLYTDNNRGTNFGLLLDRESEQYPNMNEQKESGFIRLLEFANKGPLCGAPEIRVDLGAAWADKAVYCYAFDPLTLDLSHTETCRADGAGRVTLSLTQGGYYTLSSSPPNFMMPDYMFY